MVHVEGTVLQEAIFAGYQVAVKDDEIGSLFVQDFVDDLERVDILLRAPLIPGILALVNMCYLTGAVLTFTEMQVFKDG